jgi:hypothetical protein
MTDRRGHAVKSGLQLPDAGEGGSALCMQGVTPFRDFQPDSSGPFGLPDPSDLSVNMQAKTHGEALQKTLHIPVYPSKLGRDLLPYLELLSFGK